MKRKIFIFVGSVLVLAGFTFFIEPLRTWIQDPSYTELEMFLRYWKEYLIGTIVIIFGAQLVFHNIYKDETNRG